MNALKTNARDAIPSQSCSFKRALYMYIYIYIYMCMCIYIYIYIYICVCMYICLMTNAREKYPRDSERFYFALTHLKERQSTNYIILYYSILYIESILY